MTVNSKLFKVSYKIGGKTAKFYARTASEPQIGRKVAVHEYPQSDTRYVQDNGKIAGIYTLEVNVGDQKGSASNNIKLIKTLISCLQTPGIGTLTHPEFGKKKVVPTQSSRRSNIINEAGFFNSFTLTFMESDPNKYPTGGAGNVGFLGKLFDEISGKNGGFFGDALNALDAGLDAFNDARDTIEEVTSAINDAVSTVNGFVDDVAAFVADIGDLQSSIISLMQTPTKLALRLNTVWANISNITDNFGNMFNLSLNIYGTGSDRTPLAAQTPITKKIEDNRNVIYNYNKVAALNLAYMASVNIDYVSQDQVDNNLKLLDAAFEQLDPNTVNEDVYYSMQDMRVQNRLYLENLKLGLPYIQTINTNSVPVSVLTYNYYADSTRSDEVINLNEIEDPAFAYGKINILSF